MTNSKMRIAHLAGPTATIQNSPPLVTSNKARAKHGLPPKTDEHGEPLPFDALRPQRLAAPVTVYVEQFSAHPLESDAAELYGSPDGYLGKDGTVRPEPESDDDTPVYEVQLDPSDGLYPLPYMAVQADGTPWEEEMAVSLGSELKARQGFFPDGSRTFEEIDRLSVEVDGTASPVSRRAVVDFYRVAPSGGYKNGLPGHLRTDIGEGDIPAEQRGVDFNGYKPYHLATAPARPALAKITNDVQAVAGSGQYDGLVWTQGSPQVEETAYWMNLLIDTALPICGNAAQRPQGQTSNDGPQNIIDSLSFIKSGVWKDEAGENRCGVIVIEEQQYFAAREVYKSDARPGNYRATGGHGGILGQTSHTGAVSLVYLPAYKHTHTSDLRITRLPDKVNAVARRNGQLETVEVQVKDAQGELLQEAIPSVSIVKEGGYFDEEFGLVAEDHTVLRSIIDHKLELGRLCGLIAEGLVPYGRLPSRASSKLMERAVFSGLPVVHVGRGTPEGFADPTPLFIAGSNLTSIKARILLMAALMKYGSLPVAADPLNPTEAEREATERAVARYQGVFNTH